MPEIEALAADPRVFKVKGPMRRFGMIATDPDGREGYVRKSTTYLTSSAELAEVLNGECSNKLGVTLASTCPIGRRRACSSRSHIPS